LIRFLTLYLGSVFVLLAIIGYLFFENNRTAMKSAMKFEMMYQGRMLSSKIVMKAMKDKTLDETQKVNFLASLKHCRFNVGYFDKEKEPIYTEIGDVTRFDTDFYVKDNCCYTVIEDPSDHLGVHYVVLKENELVDTFRQLRIKIIGYLLLSFLLMGIVGYFLGRLFLRPVREQIESLDQFISDTTHELNTPISAILMTIQSLKGIDEKKKKRLEASAKRLHVMYSSLTYRLEGQEEKIELLPFDKIVEERVGYIKELIDSKRLHLTMELEPMPVRMSRSSAERLVDNLLSNAVKYCDIGDTIRITLKGREFRVKDTGIGIDAHMQEDIFKRYKRANSERGGFGIGLNIVLSICKKYKIKLNLESEKGVGSTFILSFPKAK
ncbi:MAG TPA: HAMP domain-containing histidine kinase, partial [Epsilonproteobacteria bacterium]|nr:HAMP domain-containing histidine kinase [Campylobacterota bacterium]